MANLIKNANLWTDNNGHNPPAIWDGTKYDFSGLTLIALTGPVPADGDTIEFTLDIMAAAPNPEGNAFILEVSQGAGTLYNSPLKPTGSTVFASGSLSASGGSLSILYNPQSLTDYAADFTIIPPPPTPHIVPQSPVTIVYD